MDWAKLKSILIFALIVANVIIAYFLFQKSENKLLYSDEERLDMIEEVLSKKQIINNITTPPLAETMPKVEIEYQNYDLKSIADRLFDNEYKEEGGAYHGKDYAIMLVDNGSVFYLKSRKKALRNPALDFDNAKISAEEFLKKLGFKNDYFYIGHEYQGNLLKLNYIQSYKGYFIDNTYMTVTMDSEINAIERRWAIVRSGEGEALNIIPYATALFIALDEIEKGDYPRPLKIEDLKLGFGLKNSVFGEDVLSGEALPYYRFFLSEGEDIVIPALKVK